MGGSGRNRVRFLIGLFVFALLVSPSASGAGPSPLALPAGVLEPPHTVIAVDFDAPPDSEYDSLIVSATIHVTVGGEFILGVSALGFGLAGRSFLLTPGAHEVLVPVDGHLIREYNLNGPLTLELVLEVSCQTGCQVIDTDSIPIDVLRASDFEGPEIVFAGTPTDSPVDTDVPSDGRVDALSVDVPVTVYERGEYVVWGYYLGSYQVANVSLLDPGPAVMRLLVPGYRLRDLSNRSSTFMTLYVAGRSQSGAASSRSIAAGPHEWSEFESWPAALPATGTFEEAVDTDLSPDGLADVLDLHVPIEVAKAGDYRFVGYLMGPSGSQLGDTSSARYLDPGTHEIVLRFGSALLVANQVDGPLTFAFSLYAGGGMEAIANGNRTTRSYNGTEFDPLPYEIAGAVLDEYVDIDSPADGIYDEYVARLPVIVRESGVYRVLGILNVPGGQFLAENMTRLVPGTTHVNVTWPIGAFRAKDTVPPSIGEIVTYLPAYSPLQFVDYAVTPAPTSGGNASNETYPALARPSLTFEGPPETLLFDADGDGLVDAIQVRFPVNVTRAGRYEFAAALSGTYATNRTDLVAGPGSVRFFFPGWAIRRAGFHGPYFVFVRYGTDLARFSETYYGYTPLLSANQFDDSSPSILSALTASPPVLDGTLGPDEWSESTVVTLATPDPGAPPATAYLSNDEANLYVALDVVADRTEDDMDAGGIALDAGGIAFDSPGLTFRRGGDMEVAVGCDPALLEHVACTVPGLLYRGPRQDGNVTAVRGFGPTNLDARPHRTYEYRVPLAVLGVTAGATLGFAVHTGSTRGIRDGSGPSLGWPVTSLFAFEDVPKANFARLLLGSQAPENLPPVFAITGPSSGTFVSGATAITGTASDPDGSVVRVEVRVDGGPWSTASGTATWSLNLDTTTYPDGPHTVEARAFDGTAYSPIAWVTITFDNTGPDVVLSTPQAGALLSSSDIRLRWAASDGLSGLSRIEVRLDGGAPTVLSGSDLDGGEYTIHDVSDGTHVVAFSAVDAAGNAELASASVTVDATAPVVSFRSPGDGAILTSSRVVVLWAATDATSGLNRILVQLDDGMAVDVGTAESHVFEGVTDGSHTLRVSALDAAGHSTTDEVVVRVDTSTFSPSGPYGPYPIVGIAAVLIVLAAVVTVRYRMRGRARPPRQS